MSSLIEVPVVGNTQSSRLLVPFLVGLYGIEQSPIVSAINTSVQKLDNLAIEVDTILDENNPESSIPDLEEKVSECLSDLSNLINTERLHQEIMDDISKSLMWNTSGRSRVYCLSGGKRLGSTMLYLRPLMHLLVSQALMGKWSIARPLFIEIANYVQFLDDVSDLHEDIDAGIKTPVTIAYETNSKEGFLSIIRSHSQITLNGIRKRIATIAGEDFLRESKEVQL